MSRTTRNQTKILNVLVEMGEGTYDEIMRRYLAIWGPTDQSSEGIARRCREMAKHGLIIDTGKRAEPKERIVWTASQGARAERNPGGVL